MDDLASNRLRKRREPRYACSYPAVMRFLFPERSFVPLSLAVRVVNLSSGGALVEVHEGSLDEETSVLRGCYFELRIASSGGVPLYGRVARIGNQDHQRLLGLMFHHAHPELIGRLIHGESASMHPGDLLPVPVLDPYSPLTEEEIVVLTGRAREAERIVLQSERGETAEFPVEDGRFRLSIPLPAEGDHGFRILAAGGRQQSPALPVNLTRLPSSESDFHFEAKVSQDSNGRQIVTMEFAGSGMAAPDVLERAAWFLKDALRVRVMIRGSSLEGCSEEQLDKLRREVEELRGSLKQG